MFWYECYECGYKPASIGDAAIHALMTSHGDMVLVEDEDLTGLEDCACVEGSVDCSVDGCDEWADMCQGLTTCWNHEENN